jgi:single-strand DNA-binding protein
MNKCMFIGNLGRDPEMAYLPDGTTIAKFSVAVSEKYKTKSGEKKETTEWINCVVFGKSADIVGQYLGKGDKIYVEGKQTTRSWEGNDGVKKYMTEIKVSNFEFLNTKGEKSNGQAAPASSGFDPYAGGGSLPEDDVPF